MENSFKHLLDESKSVLILLPTNAYFDQVAAGLSLYLSLRDKKDITIASPEPMTVEFNRLIGINKITQDVGNKNLIIRFAGYEASNIEKVSYDIENKQFKLTVIPKASFKAPEKSQVTLNYAGLSSDLVILVGGALENHFPALSEEKEIVDSKIVHIGVRDLSIDPAKKVISLAVPAASVSELMSRTIREAGLELKSDTATNLLMGIEDATDSFSSEDVTADTFNAVADLMRLGGKRTNQQPQADPANFPPGAIPGQYPQPLPQQMTQQMPMPTPLSNIPTQPKVAVNPNQQPMGQQTSDDNVPEDWLTKPKIYKGTTPN